MIAEKDHGSDFGEAKRQIAAELDLLIMRTSLKIFAKRSMMLSLHGASASCGADWSEAVFV